MHYVVYIYVQNEKERGEEYLYWERHLREMTRRRESRRWEEKSRQQQETIEWESKTVRDQRPGEDRWILLYCLWFDGQDNSLNLHNKILGLWSFLKEACYFWLCCLSAPSLRHVQVSPGVTQSAGGAPHLAYCLGAAPLTTMGHGCSNMKLAFVVKVKVYAC